MRRIDPLQQLLAVQRLQFPGPDMNGVDIEAASPGFGDDALEHLVGAGAPGSYLDAVSLFERGHEQGHVLLVERGVEHQDAFFARAGQQALLAVGAVVQRDRRILALLSPGDAARADGQQE